MERYVPMVEIPVTDHEILLRESEQLEIVKRFLRQEFCPIGILKQVCGIEEEREDESIGRRKESENL